MSSGWLFLFITFFGVCLDEHSSLGCMFWNGELLSICKKKNILEEYDILLTVCLNPLSSISILLPPLAIIFLQFISFHFKFSTLRQVEVREREKKKKKIEDEF